MDKNNLQSIERHLGVGVSEAIRIQDALQSAGIEALINETITELDGCVLQNSYDLDKAVAEGILCKFASEVLRLSHA